MIARILTVAIALWLGGGAIAYGAGHARYGLTPSVAWLAAAVAIAILVRRHRAPLVSILLVLPWLPVRLPAAALIWTGHAAWWIAALIAAAVAATWLHAHAGTTMRRCVVDPHRAPSVACAIAAALFLAAAWRVSPVLPSGDEPHYLVITQSLLRDHDLQIENNHRRGDYRAYYDDELRPDYLRRGVNGEIYSIHAPGLPTLIAPAFALFGYPGVVVFLTLLAAMTSALAWSTAFRVTNRPGAAWFGWAVVTLSAPFFVQSFMVYPEAPAGAIVMVAIATLVRGRDATLRRLAVTGVALALLPWLHTRAVILAVMLGAVLALREWASRPIAPGSVDARTVGVRLAALFAAPILSAVGWLAFFYAIYGVADPRAPYRGAQQLTLSSLPHGLLGLLVDQQFGLLPNAPVYLCAFAGFAALARRHTRLAIELLVSLVPYVLAVAAFPMWWAGYTTPARFLVAALPPLAIPAAAGFAAVRRRGVRLLWGAGLALSVLITAAMVTIGRGALLLNFRDGSSRVLAWLSPVADLTTATPSMFRNTPIMVTAEALVWVAAVAMVVGISSLVPHLKRERAIASLGLCAAACAMIAAAIVWQMNGAAGLVSDGGALTYLAKYDGDARQLALSLSPLRATRRVEIPPRLSLADAAPARDAPLAYLRHVPAATYVVELRLATAANGHVTVALDREIGPAWTFDVSGATGVWQHDIDVPVATPVLIVDADPGLRASIDRVSIRATRVPGSRHRLADGEATHVVRYGRTLVFLLGGDAFVEPAGIWMQGASSADFAIASDAGGPIHWLIRTVPVANQVTVQAGDRRQDLSLAAGEATAIDVPQGRVHVAVRSGARPADFEAGSADRRFLGAWIEVR